MTTISAPAPVRSSDLSTRTMIDIDVGPFRLGLDSNLILGVHDHGQMTTLSVPDAPADDFAVGGLVRTDSNLVRAVYMDRLLSVESKEPRQPMVSVRGRRQGDSYQTLGLFVDATSRPRTVDPRDWHPMPAWMKSTMRIPCNAMVVTRSQSGEEGLRVLLDTPKFDTQRWNSDERSVVSQVTQTGQADPVRPVTDGVPGANRGLLVFAPNESERRAMRVAIAVPMSSVLGVELNEHLIQIPTLDPHLAGVAVWNNLPIPVIHLGDALGLKRLTNPSGQNVSRQTRESARLLVFRTPSNQILGCLAHAQMRSLRTPRTTSVIDDCGMNHDHLLGAFLTREGPLAVPDLDRLVTGSQFPSLNLNHERWKV